MNYGTESRSSHICITIDHVRTNIRIEKTMKCVSIVGKTNKRTIVWIALIVKLVILTIKIFKDILAHDRREDFSRCKPYERRVCNLSIDGVITLDNATEPV